MVAVRMMETCHFKRSIFLNSGSSWIFILGKQANKKIVLKQLPEIYRALYVLTKLIWPKLQRHFPPQRFCQVLCYPCIAVTHSGEVHELRNRSLCGNIPSADYAGTG
jgi:hypothetical protein